MKLIYSELKKWLPDLTVDPKQLRDDITMIGHFASGYEEIDGEVVLDLEVRQNRADCLGYYGIARDISVFYQIDINFPKINPITFTNEKVPISINTKDVHRIQSAKLSNIKNSPSLPWLSKILQLHDINPINTLVDLTNYVMLQWGIPCHAFDIDKAPQLNWENNNSYSEFTSLDGTKLKLLPKNILVTSNSKVVSLSFIGGQNSSIELDTNETILEMAIYNRSKVRSDSRALKTITEASIRLDKELDTETIPTAFSHLLSLVQEHCNGVISSQLFDLYSHKPKIISIPFDPISPSMYSGVNIPESFSISTLNRLGCINNNNNLITPPSIRKDITITEDLIEEVIRFYGYNKIPINDPINSTQLPDITPKILYLIESLKDRLIDLGYDEVRSWPLVQKSLDDTTAIYTQNSINSEYPVLRQSILQSLKNQLEQYTRYKLPIFPFFEIGKIYLKSGDAYTEKYSLGIYNQTSLQEDLQKLDLKPTKTDGDFAEVILEDLDKIEFHKPSSQHNTATELTSQIITLDANVSFDSPQDQNALIEKYSNIIGPDILWSMEIIDVYQNRYTFRVCYFNCSDKDAKRIHLKSFDLI